MKESLYRVMEVYTTEEHNRKRRFFGRIKTYLILGSLLTLVALAAYVIFLSPIFRITVEVTGQQRLSVVRLLNDIYGQFSQKFWTRLFGNDHYLSWSAGITASEPLLAKLIVKKDLWNKKIFLIVQERQPYGAWCFNDLPSCYWFDEAGVIFEPAPVPDGPLIIKVDSATQSVKMGEAAIKSEWFNLLKRVIDFFQKQSVAIKSYGIKDDLQEIHARHLSGAIFRFSLRFDPDSSFAGLKTFLEKNSLRGINYIDLTVENRLYAK